MQGNKIARYTIGYTIWQIIRYELAPYLVSYKDKYDDLYNN